MQRFRHDRHTDPIELMPIPNTTMRNPSFDTPVLIVGGGPVGFALALDLAVRGNRSIVIERDAGTATELLAKAGTLNERTMEFCRRWGIADQVANVGFPDDYPRDVIYCTSLAGHLLGRDKLPSALDREAPPATPEMLRKCPQHLFDPLLANEVKRRGLTEIRYSTRFDGLEQDAEGVTALVSDVVTGKQDRIRARYLAACDGAGSLVRRQLEIPFEGIMLDYSVSALIRVPALEQYHDKGRGERFLFIGTEGTWANLTAVDGRELWRFTMVGSAEKLNPANFDIATAIRRCMGSEDIPFDIVKVAPWLRTQCAAKSFRSGRVLLAGDSSHTTSPTGGHGLNTGLGDVSDLGWMLDAELKGWAGEHLLDAYSRERKPVAIRNSSSSTANYGAWVEKVGRDQVLQDSPEGQAQRDAIYRQMSAKLQQEWFSTGVGMGYRYENSPVIVADGTPEPADPPTTYTPTARPGHRAPHAWLADGRSTLDLFGNGFVLLRINAPALSVIPLLTAAKNPGVPMHVVDLQGAEIAALYGSRLVLVRPDGQVAWRGDALPQDCNLLIDTIRGAFAPTMQEPASIHPPFVVPE